MFYICSISFIFERNFKQQLDNKIYNILRKKIKNKTFYYTYFFTFCWILVYFVIAICNMQLYIFVILSWKAIMCFFYTK